MVHSFFLSFLCVSLTLWNSDLSFTIVFRKKKNEFSARSPRATSSQPVQSFDFKWLFNLVSVLTLPRLHTQNKIWFLNDDDRSSLQLPSLMIYAAIPLFCSFMYLFYLTMAQTR